MFEEFSSGYYLGRFYVEPSQRRSTVMHDTEFELMSEEVYSGKDLEALEDPLVMKIGRNHLWVKGERGVPSMTLEVPKRLMEELDVRNPPALKEVLVAKPGRAADILALTPDDRSL